MKTHAKDFSMLPRFVLHAYDIAIHLFKSSIKLSFEALLFVISQEAVLQTVSVIFEDPGVQDLLVKLYQKGNSFIAALSFVLFFWGVWFENSN